MGQPSRRRMIGAFGLVAFMLACPTSAASQGSMGATSSASIRISVSVSAPAIISGLSDVEFDGTSTSVETRVSQDLCFRGATGAYEVAASGSGPGGALSLSNGSESIAYRAELLTWPEMGSVEPRPAGWPVTIQAVASRSDCGRPQGAGQLRISIEPADAETMQVGSPYTGLLVLMLAPQ